MQLSTAASVEAPRGSIARRTMLGSSTIVTAYTSGGWNYDPVSQVGEAASTSLWWAVLATTSPVNATL